MPENDPTPSEPMYTLNLSADQFEVLRAALRNFADDSGLIIDINLLQKVSDIIPTTPPADDTCEALATAAERRAILTALDEVQNPFGAADEDYPTEVEVEVRAAAEILSETTDGAPLSAASLSHQDVLMQRAASMLVAAKRAARAEGGDQQ